MKSREHVITNGRAVFYASMWEDLKNSALDCGWALGLHGSLNSDMDIMAMAWTEDAKPIEEMIKALEGCFTIPEKGFYKQTTISKDKPNNRIVYTIHIFADFYLDINVISLEKQIPTDSRVDAVEKENESVGFANWIVFSLYTQYGFDKWRDRTNGETKTTTELFTLFSKEKGDNINKANNETANLSQYPVTM